MSIKKLILRETAVAGTTSAGNVATSFSSFMNASSNEATNLAKPNKHIRLVKGSPFLKKRKRVGNIPVINFRRVLNFEDFATDIYLPTELYEYDSNIDPTEVISKLKSTEKFAKDYSNATVFGLEDDEGNIVKVYVNTDQADEFESLLGREIEDQVNSPKEIAELLFSLKDNIDIVNIVWPTVQEDEEVDTEGAPDEEGLDSEGELDSEEELDSEGELDSENDVDLEGEGDLDDTGTDSLDQDGSLQKVIALLTAQAEAQTAEANAKAEQAKADQAKATADAAEFKIKGEEEVLDMEAYNKQGKQEEEESKKLSKLATYRHAKKTEHGVTQLHKAAEDEESKAAAVRGLVDYLTRSNKVQY